MNAWTTVMSQVFKQAGLKAPFLDEYVARREELFQELCTPTRNKAAVKVLFLIAFHAGNYRYKAKVTIPFLEQFQREMKTCAELLLLDPCFASVRALVENKSNPLGSAITLISQLNESKVMAAKTVFTERSLRVATDLFDGHLRETGVLDLEACSKFVEEKTGFKVVFATKMGTDVWELPKRARSAGAFSSPLRNRQPARFCYQRRPSSQLPLRVRALLPAPPPPLPRSPFLPLLPRFPQKWRLVYLPLAPQDGCSSSTTSLSLLLLHRRSPRG